MDKDNYTILSEAYLQARAAYDICVNDSSIVRSIRHCNDQEARINFDLIYTALSEINRKLQMLVEADKSSWEP